MNRVCKNLNNVQTEMLTWGDPFVDNGQDVVVCITGNPGVIDFYIDFASELYKNIQRPICVIGHAGHNDNSNDISKELGNNDCLFNLKAQISHKLDLFKNHIHHNKIHLIGHSIGAWIIVELLHKNEQLMDRVLSTNLLFPTLQRMSESKNGKFVNFFFRKYFHFILCLCKLLNFLPIFIIRFIIAIYLMANSLPSSYCNAITKMLNPAVIEKVLLMAFNEMDIVKKLNRDGINKIKHLTHIVYTHRDGWVPIEYIDDLKKYEPHIQMTHAHDIEHAFVLKSSEQVADMVTNFIKLSDNK